VPLDGLDERADLAQRSASDHRRGSLPQAATGRRVEHPLRNFERSAILFFEAAAEAGYGALRNGTNDQHCAAVPRMPPIED